MTSPQPDPDLSTVTGTDAATATGTDAATATGASSAAGTDAVGGPTEGETSARVTKRGRMWVTLGVAAIVLLIDQVTKSLVVAKLTDQPPINVIGDLLKLDLVRNPGAAFSLGTGYTFLFTGIALAVVVVIIRTSRKLGSTWWALALGGMLGGALGNLADRMFREPGSFQGYVVDFIELPHYPVFNCADMAIVGSAILMVILAVRGIDLDGTRHSA